jgi:rubrerythrin
MDEDAEWVTVVIDSNLGRNTGRREVMGADPVELKRNMLLKDLYKQIQDEQEAYNMYSSMAVVAHSLGYEDVAGHLRRVANDEAGHKSTLQHMVDQLSSKYLNQIRGKPEPRRFLGRTKR